MKEKRDMFYSNYQAGGFNNFQPQGFYTSGQYQAFGPNVIPNTFQDNEYISNYEHRLDNIENQLRQIEQRVTKLEKMSLNNQIDPTNNNYII